MEMVWKIYTSINNMPEILKNRDGTTNWTALIAAIGATVVLILQQWQTYKIAEIKAEAEVQRVMFLEKDKVYAIEKDLQNRMQHLESEYIPRNDLNGRLQRIENDIDYLRGFHNDSKKAE